MSKTLPLAALCGQARIGAVARSAGLIAYLAPAPVHPGTEPSPAAVGADVRREAAYQNLSLGRARPGTQTGQSGDWGPV